MDHTFDGGPAFPVQDASTWQAYGMTKRELFAAILMHSEAVTCGVPGEAADALIEAASRHDRDVIDHMATNAVEGADALLRALAEPRIEPPPPHLSYDAYTTTAAEHYAVKALAQHHSFDDMPAVVRDFVKVALEEIEKADSGIPF